MLENALWLNSGRFLDILSSFSNSKLFLPPSSNSDLIFQLNLKIHYKFLLDLRVKENSSPNKHY